MCIVEPESIRSLSCFRPCWRVSCLRDWFDMGVSENLWNHMVLPPSVSRWLTSMWTPWSPPGFYQRSCGALSRSRAGRDRMPSQCQHRICMNLHECAMGLLAIPPKKDRIWMNLDCLLFPTLYTTHLHIGLSEHLPRISTAAQNASSFPTMKSSAAAGKRGKDGGAAGEQLWFLLGAKFSTPWIVLQCLMLGIVFFSFSCYIWWNCLFLQIGWTCELYVHTI